MPRQTAACPPILTCDLTLLPPACTCTQAILFKASQMKAKGFLLEHLGRASRLTPQHRYLERLVSPTPPAPLIGFLSSLWAPFLMRTHPPESPYRKLIPPPLISRAFGGCLGPGLFVCTQPSAFDKPCVPLNCGTPTFLCQLSFVRG